MHWGLSHERPSPPGQGESHGPVRYLSLYVPFELHEDVKQAAAAAGVNIAPWLRHMVRQITITDFPASWQEERPAERSHDSRTYGTRFMLRLDEPSQTKLQQLITQFGASKAEIIRPSGPPHASRTQKPPHPAGGIVFLNQLPPCAHALSEGIQNCIFR
jgi:hypothetical protein